MADSGVTFKSCVNCCCEPAQCKCPADCGGNCCICTCQGCPANGECRRSDNCQCDKDRCVCTRCTNCTCVSGECGGNCCRCTCKGCPGKGQCECSDQCKCDLKEECCAPAYS